MPGQISRNPSRFTALICVALVAMQYTDGSRLTLAEETAAGIAPRSSARHGVETSAEGDFEKLPYFPLANHEPAISSDQSLSRPDSAPQQNSAAAKSQQQAAKVLPKDNIEIDGLPDMASTTYVHLDYVTISADIIFADDNMFLQTPPGECTHASSMDVAEGSGIFPVNTAQFLATTQDVAKQSDSTNVRRPLSSIRLADSLSTNDDDGKPLSTPEDIPFSAMPVVENHFVPAPWHRSHASRNTYRIRYQPLYFEDPNMERCGDSNGCLTELTSIIHFASRIPLLPYMMASDSPHKCVDALPDCPTCQRFGPDAYLPKPTVKAVAAQAAATVGAIYIVP